MAIDITTINSAIASKYGNLDAEYVNPATGEAWESASQYVAYKQNKFAAVPKNKKILVKQADGKDVEMTNRNQSNVNTFVLDSSSSVNVVNNLTSDSTEDALSANQGKNLKTQVDTVDGKVTTLQTNVSNLNSDVTTLSSRINDIVSDLPEDGFSPTASVRKVGNKSTITIVDKNGTTTADVYDGQTTIAVADGTFADAPSDGARYVRCNAEWVPLAQKMKTQKIIVASSPVTIPDYVNSQTVELTWTPQITTAPSFTNLFTKGSTTIPTASAIISASAATNWTDEPIGGKKVFYAFHVVIPEGQSVEVGLWRETGCFKNGDGTYTNPITETGWFYTISSVSGAGAVNSTPGNTAQWDSMYAIDITALENEGKITLPSGDAAQLNYLKELFGELYLLPGENYTGGSGGMELKINDSSIPADSPSATVAGGDVCTCTGGSVSFNVNYYVNEDDNDPEEDPNASVSTENTIDLSNVDRILVVGASITEGMYYQKGKAWVNLYSEQIDYNVEGYGASSGTSTGIASALKSDSARYNAIKPSKLNCKYALISQGANDVRMQPGLGTFGEDFETLVRQIEAMGMKPIIADEYTGRDGMYQHVHQCSAKLHNTEYWPVLSLCQWLMPNKDNQQFFQAGHTGQRTGSINSDPFVALTKARLPRPNQSIKIYRKRGSSTDITTDWDKLKNFQEIGLSHSCLANPAGWDNLSTLSNGQFAVGQNSEYGALMAGGSIAANGDYLVQIILPTDKNNCTEVYLDIESATAYKVWNGSEWLNASLTSNLQGYIKGDKLSVLVTGSTISAPKVRWKGVSVSKPFAPTSVFRSGNEMLTATAASAIDTAHAVAISGYSYSPSGTSKVVKVTTSAGMTIEIPRNKWTPGGTFPDRTLRIVARWNPSVNDSSVTLGTCDRRRIVIKADSTVSSDGSAWSPVGSFDVGMGWTIIEIPVQTYPGGGNWRKLQLFAENDPIEIDYVSFLDHQCMTY